MQTVVIPDVHVPFHHRGAIRKLLAFLKDTKPAKIVFLGDVMDFHALSTHRRDPRWEDNLAKELAAGRKFLRTIREAAPRAEIHTIQGNHEDRWERYIQGRVPVMRLLGISWSEALKLGDIEIKLSRHVRVPCGQGKTVKCMHGHEVKGHSKLPAGHAFAIAKKMGENIHIGHTHRLGLLSGVIAGKDIFAVEGGYLGDFDREGFAYMGPAKPEWVRSWAVYDSTKTDNPYPRFIRP